MAAIASPRRRPERAASARGVGAWLAAALLVAGCDIDTPQQGTPVPAGNSTQIASADGSSVSIAESSPAYGGGPGAVTFGASAAPQEAAQCSPDGRYVIGNTIYLDYAERAVEQEIGQVKRTLDEVNSRIDQCKGKSKGLTEYDAQFGCDRARLREIQARAVQLGNLWEDMRAIAPREWAEMEAAGDRAYVANQRMRQSINRIELGLAMVEFAQAEADFAKASKAIDTIREARRTAAAAERASLQAAIDQMKPLCERAETAYEQNPCNSTQLAGDAFTRNRAQQRLAALEARRSLIKDCRKDRERQAGTPQGIGSPAAQDLLIQTLPGLMGGFRPHRPPKDAHQHDQPSSSRQPQWHDHKN